jgi:2-polyprenyl-3-methyl-5-hydroxy-6-metoxy-1,4-benzoquinol methylase
MHEMIGKVKVNLEFYRGEDFYSDGPIEDEILNVVKNAENYFDVISKDNRWPILYHLSPIRENIIDWYPFEEDAEILEIGAGCGAITGALCNNTQKVVCVELSKKRALINAYRHIQKDNLEIVVGNFNDIKLNNKFDYITLIGVLEYAASYTDTENPYEDFLRKIKGLLKPSGKLIIAIENKFGLKYWSGCREDHTGEFFDGIQNYIGNKKVSTFSKKEVEKILYKTGFDKLEFYYPMPDYKLPSQMFSDKKLPNVGELKNLISNYDQNRVVLFDECLAYDNIIKNGEFDFFANSFLISCSI